MTLLLLPTQGKASGIDGAVDLQRADWEQIQVLDGTWRYFPSIFLNENSLRDPNFDRASGYPVRIPGDFSNIIDRNGQRLGPKTWGTLVLELKNLQPDFAELGLHLRGDSAFEVFALDLGLQKTMQRLIKVGQPAATESQSIPQIASPLGHWRVDGSGHYLLVIHISGFHYTQASLWTSPRLARYEALKHEQDLILALDCLVTGMMFVMTFYYLSLFLHRFEDRASLVLSIFSCCLMLRLLACSATMGQVFFPQASLALYATTRLFEFGLLGILGTCGAWFAVESFQLQKLLPLIKWEGLIGILAFFFCLLTTAEVYANQLLVLNLILGIQVLICLGICIWAFLKKIKGSIYLVLGVSGLSATIVFDMAIGLGYLPSSLFLAPFGMSFLLFNNGQVVAKLFASAFRTAQRLSLSLQAEVDRKTRKMTTMLDNIPQGVLNIVPPGVADTEYSKHLEGILGTGTIAEQTLEQLLLNQSLLEVDEKARILAALQTMLGETALNFELNCSQLPSEITLNQNHLNKYLHLNWAPIVNEQGTIESIQLTLHDLTLLKTMEQQSQKQSEELSFIQEVIGIPIESFQIFIDSSMQLLEENRRLIFCNERGNPDIIKILFVNMHTVKGSARTLGLQKIATHLHLTEQTYVQLLKESTAAWRQDELLQQIDTLDHLVKHYLHISRHVLGRQIEKVNEVGLQRDFLEKHCLLLAKLSQSIEQPELHSKLIKSLQILEEQVFQDATDFFQNLISSAERIGKDLGKDPPLVLVEAQDYLLSQDAEMALGKALIHIIRNAMDHGIEIAQERLEKSKAPFGCIRIQCLEYNHYLRITVEDDGRGLPIQKLREKSFKYGLSDPSNPEAIAQLIFQAGLSTAATVTDISGRGMGMDAVRKFMRDLGGEVEIELVGNKTADEVPFRLHLFLPEKYFRQKRPSELALAS